MIRIAVVVLLLAITGCVPGRRPKPNPDPSPTPTPVVVPADFSEVTKVVRQGDKTRIPELRKAFEGYAWVIGRADIQKTSDLAAVSSVFERLRFANTDMASKFPGLSTAANNALLAALGDEDRELKPGEAEAVIRKLAEACK